MPNLNQVTLVGHISAPPELRHAPKGTPIATFSMAVNTEFGETKEVFWARVTCFGGWAEGAAKLGKGAAVFVSGRLKTDEWTDKETGKKQSKTAVIANVVLAIEKREQPTEQRQPATPKQQPEPPVEEEEILF